jgi:hypothetical protein
MRFTINLDSEVYDFVSACADAKEITLSRAISGLVRRAESIPAPKSD